MPSPETSSQMTGSARPSVDLGLHHPVMPKPAKRKASSRSLGSTAVHLTVYLDVKLISPEKHRTFAPAACLRPQTDGYARLKGPGGRHLFIRKPLGNGYCHPASVRAAKRRPGHLLVLAVGAVASAFAPGIWWLIAFRAVLGFGTGGDYPVSATIISEYANRKDRARMVSLVFAMQGAGLVIGPLLAIGLLATGASYDVVWRLLLGLGAIPALSVFWLRRQIRETPRFELAPGLGLRAARLL
jgi:Sugar (and other) transporter